jgi:hypothetical protein
MDCVCQFLHPSPSLSSLSCLLLHLNSLPPSTTPTIITTVSMPIPKHFFHRKTLKFRNIYEKFYWLIILSEWFIYIYLGLSLFSFEFLLFDFLLDHPLLDGLEGLAGEGTEVDRKRLLRRPQRRTVRHPHTHT